MKHIFSIVALILLARINMISQWEEIKTIPNSYKQTYWFEIWFLNTDPNYGWICGSDGKVIRTTDAGKTWAGSWVGGAIHLEGICFLNKNIGYTSGGGYIFKTTNGGVSWVDVTPFGSTGLLWGNYFINPNVGCVIGGGCNDGGPLTSYNTSDGGMSWAMSTVVAPNSAFSDLVLYPNGHGFATSNGLIWSTDDFGANWSLYSKSGNFDWQEDLWISGKTFMVPYSVGCDTEDRGGGLRTSNDNGITWRDFSTNRPMYGGFLLDSNKGWGCGLRNAVFYTSNGGRNWIIQNCGIAPNTDLDDFWFINDTTGYVCGNNALYKYKKIDTLYPVINPGPAIKACIGDTVLLETTEFYKNYLWSNGETSQKIQITNSGTFSVNVWNNDCDLASAAAVVVNFSRPKATISAFPGNFICTGDTVTLTCNEIFPNYLWSTGEKTKNIRVSKSGSYSLTVIDSLSCQNSFSIDINIHPLPVPKIKEMGFRNFCVDDSLILYTDKRFPSMKWYRKGSLSPVSTDSFYVAYKSGEFFVEVVDTFGCHGVSDTIAATMRYDTNRVALSLVSAQKEFDLDSVAPPATNCKILKIINLSSHNFIIDDAWLIHNLAFAVPQNQFPIFIPAGDSSLLTLCYTPANLSLERDTLVLSDECWPHFLPLKAVGLPLIKIGDANCTISVLLKSTTIPLRDKYFHPNNAAPNPADNQTGVQFLYASADDKTLAVTAYLVNQLGQRISDAQISISDRQNSNNLTLWLASANFNTINLPSGLYYIIINTNSDTFYQNIIVQH
ncbi:MAG: hypothetical protein NT007_09060 [Candidatus Kapabacteria bacterium]|nr:hypothetical protein [Candidatus Kapabacteria bacterium]